MARLTKFRKPITRRVGRLVVRMTEGGVCYRPYRGRKWRMVTWAQVASLAGPEHPAIRLAENVDGKRALRRMGAWPQDDGVTG